MNAEYANYRKVWVQIAEETRKNYYNDGGYVVYNSVEALAITTNGCLVLTTSNNNIHAFAPGQWIYFNTEEME